uniref:Uncharacterized protein n=1 Tax=Arundo donax TaxID=35708 RepID=A0A0A9FHB1_ARUDO
MKMICGFLICFNLHNAMLCKTYRLQSFVSARTIGLAYNKMLEDPLCQIRPSSTTC